MTARWVGYLAKKVDEVGLLPLNIDKIYLKQNKKLNIRTKAIK